MLGPQYLSSLVVLDQFVKQSLLCRVDIVVSGFSESREYPFEEREIQGEDSSVMTCRFFGLWMDV